MLKGKTKSGFAYEISDDAVQDYELLETVAEVDNNRLLLPKLLMQLLGKEQYQKLKDHLRDDKGRVPVQDMFEVVDEIFRSGAETKNS